MSWENRLQKLWFRWEGGNVLKIAHSSLTGGHFSFRKTRVGNKQDVYWARDG